MLDLIVIAALTSSSLSPGLLASASAQTAPVKAPPLQVAGGRTSLDVTPAGTPIVNIAAPDRNGTSYNVYTSLSAGPEGLIFNNSPATGQSTVGGYLLANPNIVGGKSASLILNEVTGTVRTSLAGPIEVFGSQAALVIANPTGITCDGCGFINTSRVSLAAANLQFAADGTFSGFRTSGGDVTIEGQGLLAGNVDYFDIIASVAHINAGLYTRDLTIAGGSGTYDYAARTANGSGAGPAIAIDSSLLGGMYANRIRLIGNGTGVGVNLAGTVAALDGPLTITADGAIALAKVASSADASVTSASGSVTLADQTYAGGNLAIAAGSSIKQVGGFAGALGAASFTAAGAVSLGGSGAYAGLDADGNLTGDSDLAVRGAAIDTGNAALAAGGAIAIQGDSLNTGSGGQIGGNGLSIDVLGAIDARGIIQSSADAVLKADRIDVTGSLGANGALSLSGRQIVLAGTATGLASATAAASESFSITPAGAFQTNGLAQITAPVLTNAGTVLGDGVRLAATSLSQIGTLRVGGDLDASVLGSAVLGGVTQVDGEAVLTVGGKAALNGQFASAKSLSVDAGALAVEGSVQAAESLTLRSANDFASAATAEILANGPINFTAANGLSLNGAVGSNEALTLTGSSVDLTGTVQSMGDLTLTADTLGLSGKVLTGGALDLTVRGDAGLEGVVQANGRTTLAVGGKAALTGELSSAKALLLDAGALAVQGTVHSGDTLTLLSANDLTGGAAAEIVADGAASLIAANMLALNGTLGSNQALTLGGRAVDIGGTAQSLGKLTLTAQTLALSGKALSGDDLAASVDGAADLTGTLSAAGDLSLAAGSLSTGETAQLLSGKAVTLTARSGPLTHAGLLSAGGDATLSATGTLTQNGVLEAGGLLQLAGRAMAFDGQTTGLGGVRINADALTLGASSDLQSGAALTLHAAQDFAAGGRIVSLGEVSLISDGVLHQAAAITSNGAVTLGAITDLTQAGTVSAGGPVRLAAANLDNRGVVLTDDTLDLAASASLTNSGDLKAVGALRLTAPELTLGGTTATNAVLGLNASRVTIAGTASGLTGIASTIGELTLTASGALQSGTALTLDLAGLDNAGLISSSGPLRIGSTGAFANSGQIVSDDALTLDARGDLVSSGLLQAGTDLAAVATGKAQLSGTLYAAGDLELTAGSLASAGSMAAGNTLTITASGDADFAATSATYAKTSLGVTAGNLTTAGALQSEGALSLAADQTLALGGTAQASGVTTLNAGTSATLAGTLASGGALSFTAPEIAVSGQILANDTVNLLADARNLTLSGTIQAGSDVSLTALKRLTIGAPGSASDSVGGGSGGSSSGSAGESGSSGSGSSTGGSSGSGSGSGGSTTSLALDVPQLADSTGGSTMLALPGTLASNGAVSLTAEDIDVYGLVSAAGDLTALASHVLNVEGSVWADGKLTADLGGLSLGSTGTLASAGALKVVALGDIANLGTIASNLADITLTYGGAFTNAGTVFAKGAFTVDTSVDYAAAGTISADTIKITARDIALAGTLIGTSSLDLSGRTLALGAGSDVQTGGALSLTASRDLSLAGKLLGGASTLRADGVLSLLSSADIQASGMLSLTALGDLSSAAGSTIVADKGLTFSGAGLSLNGDAISNAGLGLVSAGGMAVGGQLTALGDLIMHSAGSLDLTGVLAAGGKLAVTSGTTTLGAASILQAGDTLSLTTGGLTAAGILQGVKGVTVASTGDAYHTGTLIAGAVDAGSGAVTSLADLSLSATGLLDLRGEVSATGNGTLSAGTLAAGGTLVTLGNLGMTAGTLGISGTLQANGVLTARGTQSVTLGGTLSGLSGLTVTSGGTLAQNAAVGSNGALTLDAAGALTHAGSTMAVGAITLKGGSLALGGTVSGNGALALTSTTGNTEIADGAVLSAGDVTLTSAGYANVAGTIVGTTRLAVDARDTLFLTSTGTLQAGTFDAEDNVDSPGHMALGAGAGIVNAGLLSSSGRIAFNSPDLINTGTVITGADLDLVGQSFSLGGTFTSMGDISVRTTSGVLEVIGEMEGRNVTLAASGGGLTLGNASHLTAYGTGSDGLLSLSGSHAIEALGLIAANGDIAVSTAGSVTIGADQNATQALASAGNVTITAGSALTNLGTLQAGKALTLSGASLDSSDLLSGETLLVTTSGNISLAGAAYGATGVSVTSSAGTIALASKATLQSAGAIDLSAARNITNAGSIVAGGPVRLSGAAIINSGTVQTDKTLDLNAYLLLASSGALEAGGALTLTAPELTLTGKNVTNAVLGLNASKVTISGTASGLTGIASTIGELTVTASGALQSGTALTLDLAGLDNAGLISSSGPLRIGSTGAFANSGQIVSDDALTLDARGDLVSSGLLQAGTELAAVATGKAQLSGTLYAAGDLELTAASLASAGSMAASNTLTITASGDADFAATSATYAKTSLGVTAGNLTTAGALQSEGTLSLGAGQALALGGTVQASGVTTLDAGTSATLTGTLASGGALSFTAPEIAVSGQILANDTVNLLADTRNLTLSGTIQAGNDVSLTALKRLTIGTPGSASGSTGGGSSSGSSGSSSGSAGGSGSSGSGSPTGGSSGSGEPVGSTTSLTLDVPQLADSSGGSTMLALPGTLASNGAVALTAEDIDVYGLVSAADDLTALASHVLNVEGSVWADGKLTADLGGLSLGSTGTLASAGSLKVTALGDIANLGTIASNLADVTLTYGGAFTNAGTVFAKGAFTVDTSADYAAAGTISADTIKITARDITLSGTLIGTSSLDLSGRTLALGAGSDVQTGGFLALTASRDLSLAGKLLGGASTLRADGALSLLSSADIQASGMLSLTALGDLSSAAGSTIVADKGLTLSGAGLALNGDAVSNAGLGLVSTGGMAVGGQLTALGDLTVHSAGSLDLTGMLAAGGKLTLTGGATTLGAASILQAGDTLSLTTGGLTAAGILQGVKDVTVASTGDAYHTGTLIAGAVDASSGAVTSLADLSLSATGLLDLRGEVSATGNGTLSAGTLAAGGTIVTLGNLGMTAGTLTTSGTLKANGALTARGTQSVTLGGTLSGLSGLTVTSGGSLVQNAAIGSNGALTLDAAGALTHAGTTMAVGAITLKGGSLALGGTVSGNGALVLTSTAGNTDIANGAVLSAGDVTLTSTGDANVSGALIGTRQLATDIRGTLSLTAAGMLQTGTTDASGNVISVGQMTLGAGTAIRNAGLLYSTGGIAFNSPGFVNTGTVSTGADINLVAQTLSLGGTFQSLGNISAGTTAGALEVMGGLEGRNLTLSATGGDITLGSASHLTAYGTGADGQLSLTSSGAISAMGVIAANNDVTLTAAQGITIGADRAGSVALAGAGNVTIAAGGAVTNQGSVQAGKALTLSGASLVSSGLLAGETLTATTTGNITLSGATYGQNGATLVSTGGALSMGSAASVQSLGAVTLRAAGDLTNSGLIGAGAQGAGTPLGAISLTSGGTLRSTGAIVSNNATVALTGSTIVLGGKLAGNGGTYAATGLTLDAAALTVLDGGEVVANQALTYNGTDLTLASGALLQSNTAMSLILDGAYRSAGTLVSLGDLSLAASGALTNLAGAGIFAGGSGASRSGGTLSLAAASIDNAGTIVAAASQSGSKGNATLAAGSIVNTGLIHADNTLGLSTANLRIEGSTATVESGAALWLDIPTVTLAAGGTLKSAGDLTLTSTSLANGGAILSGGALAITARSSFISPGTIGAAQGVTLRSNADMTLDGVVSSDGGRFSVITSGALKLGANAGLYGKTGLTAEAGSIDIVAAANPANIAMASHGDITLTSAQGLTLGGAIVADGSVSLTGTSGMTLAAGSLISAGSAQTAPSITGSNITLSGPQVSSLGTLTATGGLAFRTGALTVGGSAVANGDITLAGFGGGSAPTLTVGQGGTLASYLGNANLGTLSGLTLAGSLIASSGDVTLTTPFATITATGKLGAGRNVSLTTGVLDLAAGGEIAATNDLSLAVTGSRAGGTVAVNGVTYDLSGTPVSAAVFGKLSAGRNLSLTMPGALLIGGTAQLVASNDMSIGAGQAIIGARYTADGAGQPLTLGVIAGRDLALTGGLTLDGSMQAGRDLTITANGAGVTSTAAAQFVAGNTLSLSGASLALAGTNSGETSVSFSSPGNVTLAGATVSNGRIVLAANTATVTGSGSLTTHGGAGNLTGVGRNVGASANINLETTGDLTNNGAIWSDGLVFLKSAGGNIVNNAGGANGGITGLTVITQADSGSFLNQAGAFKAANAGLFLTGDFNNSGSFAPSGNYWISAANIINSGLLGASGDLTLTAVNNITNTGTIYSGRNLTLTAGGTLANDYVGDAQGNGQHGLILAQGNIAITAHDVANRSATIQSLGGGIGIDLTGGSLTNEIKAFSFSPETKRVKVCLQSNGKGCTEPDWVVLETGGLNLSGTTGTATISSAGDIRINAGGGNVVNRNAAILAGGAIAITTTGTVSNIADLLVNATVSTTASGDPYVSGTSNSFMPNAPTLIQAGGTVTIQAGNFENILNNRISADSFPALAPIEHAGTSGPGNGSPATGSTGNNAWGATRETNIGSGGGSLIGGSRASSAGAGNSGSGNYVTSAQGAGSAATASTSIGGSGNVATAQRSHSGGAGDTDAVTALTGAAALAGNGNAGVAGTVGTVSGVSGGVASSGLVTSSLDQTGIDRSNVGGVPIEAGNAGNVSITMGSGGRIDASKRTDTSIGSGGTLITEQREGSVVSANVVGAGSASIDAANAAAGGVTRTGFVSGTLDGLSVDPGSETALQTASGVSTGNGNANLAQSSGKAALGTANLSGFGGASLPAIGSQNFGAFLGTFLTSLNLTGQKGGSGFASNGSLFTYANNPNSAYLFTTTAALASEAALYDSSYFFDQLNLDRATTYTRLGDGLFEAMLVSKQVQAETGQAQLQDYGSALDQYQGLLKNAADVQSDLDLSLGMALTDDQVAKLTAPILWYVSTNVDGHDVLVPVLYLSASDPKAISGGALVGGTNVLITANGGITNSGTIKANEIAALAANGGDLVNASAGVIAGGTVVAKAAQDIVLQGGSTIAANGTGTYTLADGQALSGGIASLTAGRDIVSSTIATSSATGGTDRAGNGQFTITATMTEGVAGAAVNAASGLQLNAGSNIALNAAQLASGGSVSLIAGQDVTLSGSTATATTTEFERTGKRTYSDSTSTQETYIGTSITAGGPVQIGALGGTLSITGGTITTTDKIAGTIALYGAQGIDISAGQQNGTLQQFEQTGKRSTVTTTAASTTGSLAAIDAAGGLLISTPGALAITGGSLTSGEALTVTAGSFAVNGVIDTVTADVSTRTKKKGLLSSKTKTTTTSTSDETVVGSVLSGDTLAISTPGAVTINGSALVASNGLGIKAGGPVSIGTLAENDTLSQTVNVKKSGFSLGSGGLFLGVGKVKTTANTADITNIGSLIGTTAGDLSIVSSDKLSITGSQVVAGGDVLLAGKSIDIANALDISKNTQTTKSSSFGLSIKPYENVSAAANSLAGLPGRIGDNASGGAAQTGITAVSEALRSTRAVMTALTNTAGISANLGFSSSRSHSHTTESAVVGSSIAGNNVIIAATNGDLTITGSTVTGQNSVNLLASKDVILNSAQAHTETSSSSSTSGAGIGFNVGVGIVGGVNASLSATLSHSKASGTSERTAQVNTVIDGGQQLTIVSGRDTTLSGVNASATNVSVEAGRDLTLESLQDTASRSSSSYSVALGATLSGPQQTYGKPTLGGNIGAAVGSGSGHSAVVTDQTSLIAQGGSLDAHVGGTTSIIGAVIAAVDDAGKDSGQLTLATDRLIVGNITDSASSHDVSVGVSANINDPTRSSEHNNGNSPILDGAYASTAFGQQTTGTIGQSLVTIADTTSSTPLADVNRDLAQAQVVTKDTASGFSVYVDAGAANELAALAGGDTTNSVILEGVAALANNPFKPVSDVVNEVKALADSEPGNSVIERFATSLVQLVNDQKVPSYVAAQIGNDQASKMLAAIVGDTPPTAEQQSARDEYAQAQSSLLQHPDDPDAKQRVAQAFSALLDTAQADPRQQAIVDDYLDMVSKASPASGPEETLVEGHRGYVISSLMDNAPIYIGETKAKIGGAVGAFVEQHPGAGLLLNVATAVGSVADPVGFAVNLIGDQAKDFAAGKIGEVFVNSGWSDGKGQAGGDGTVFAVGVLAGSASALGSIQSVGKETPDVNAPPELPNIAHSANSAAERVPTRFIDTVVVIDRKAGKTLTGTVDLGPTLDRIKTGGSFPHRNDGSIFQNRAPKGASSPLLPAKPAGFYKEYVVPTPGVNGPGPQRIVAGSDGKMYYTPDHYVSFIPIN